jgi:hypothetical protein
MIDETRQDRSAIRFRVLLCRAVSGLVSGIAVKRAVRVRSSTDVGFVLESWFSWISWRKYRENLQMHSNKINGHVSRFLFLQGQRVQITVEEKHAYMLRKEKHVHLP